MTYFDIESLPPYYNFNNYVRNLIIPKNNFFKTIIWYSPYILSQCLCYYNSKQSDLLFNWIIHVSFSIIKMNGNFWHTLVSCVEVCCSFFYIKFSPCLSYMNHKSLRSCPVVRVCYDRSVVLANDRTLTINIKYLFPSLNVSDFIYKYKNHKLENEGKIIVNINFNC